LCLPQASDDEEAAQEEEAEAVRLQREAAAALRPEDYADGLELDGDDEDAGGSAEDEDEDEAADRTMGSAAARVSGLCTVVHCSSPADQNQWPAPLSRAKCSSVPAAEVLTVLPAFQAMLLF